MRAYKPKGDVQAKSYYNDRFFVSPQIPKEDVLSDSTYKEDCDHLSGEIKILDKYIQVEELVLYVEHTQIFRTIEVLKTELEYDFLMELSAIDFIAKRDGFELFYEMLSTTKRKRIRVKTFLKQGQAVESVNPLFRMADWAEREVFDMFGIKFNNHPLLKRILMPEDWTGNPLLKSYPLHGDEAASWYEVDKIFGKEARDVIGPEIRDAAAVDRYDTNRFARLGHEVNKDVDITNGKEPEHTPLAYQEEGGVRLFGKRLITKFEEDESKILKKRR
jgi:NADH-quinone oxidoreductase subunit C